MKIAVMAHVRQRVAEPFMGGMEAHSWHLVDGLMRRGHDVTLFAAGDSDPRLNVSPILAEHYERTYPWLEHRGSAVLNAHVDAGFAAACERIADGEFDIVHNNSLHRFPLQRAKDGGTPTVSTLHVPPFEGIEWAVKSTASPRHWFSVPSRRMLDIWWNGTPPMQAAIVPNGIALDRWAFVDEGDGSAVWSGRISRNKGPHFAAKAALQAGVPLTLYGVIEEPEYFDAAIRPLLGPEVRYGGHLGCRDLAGRIGSASALLFTPCWDEPFGLVAIEAMACGLPIAAFDRGASREVIGDDVGRFAPPDDVAALAEALVDCMALDRTAARHRVEQVFGADLMLGAYEDLYRRAMAGASI